MSAKLALVVALALSQSPRLAPEVEARATAPLAPVPAGVLEWDWLGVGGVRLRTQSSTLLFDPYVTRAPFHELLLGRLSPDEALVARLFPAADVILVGHAHYDHLGDAPALAARTGALLLGSPTTCHIARALESPRCLSPRGPWITDDGVVITTFPARHGDAPLLELLGGGRELHRPPQAPVHALVDMPHGGPRAFLVELPLGEGERARVFFHSGAGLDPPSDEVLRSLHVDVAFLGVALSDKTERWPERVLAVLKPGGTAVLTHFDRSMEPLTDELPTSEAPAAGKVSSAVPDLPALLLRMKQARPDVTVLLPRPFARVRIGR